MESELRFALKITPKTELGWRERGACFGSYVEAFFPSRGDPTKPARDICRMCTVTVECLDWAVKNNERSGVWGGTTERERAKIRRKKLDATKVS